MVWASPQLMEQMDAIRMNLGSVLYLGLIATAATVWIETMSQRWVSAQEAALFYTLDPVFSAIVSFVLLGEQLGVRGLMGATFVLAAMILSQSKSKGTTNDSGVIMPSISFASLQNASYLASAIVCRILQLKSSKESSIIG
ncbi:hypothetical protein NUACC21_35210 [Scytonema sp. NUACC21]